MNFHKMASYLASEQPLSEDELKELGYANVFVMDIEADDGFLPPEIQRLSDITERKLTPSENRIILNWFRRHAPGNYMY